jgi:pilus assembly protein FimV
VPQGASAGSHGNEKSNKQGAGAKLDASDFSDSPLAAENDLDFSLDSDSMKQGFAPTGTVKGGEFDLDLGKSEAQNLAPADTVSDLQAMEFTIDTPAESSAIDVSKSEEGMDFDFGNLNSTDLNTDIDEPVKKVAEFVQTMPSLDIDTFQTPKFMPDSATEAVETISDKVRDLKDAITVGGFEFPMPTETPEDVGVPDTGVLDISGLDTDTKESNDDFNFNLDTLQPELSKTNDDELESLDLPPAKEDEANPVDLSGIDLDLNGSESTVEVMADVSEPIEVETKLELVVAYIEMDDKEGAKELLDEVMKEGGAKIT